VRHYIPLIQGCHLFPFYSSPHSSKNHHHCLVTVRQSLTDPAFYLFIAFHSFQPFSSCSRTVAICSKPTEPSGIHTCPTSCSSVCPSLSLLAAANLCNVGRPSTCYSHGYCPLATALLLSSCMVRFQTSFTPHPCYHTLDSFPLMSKLLLLSCPKASM